MTSLKELLKENPRRRYALGLLVGAVLYALAWLIIDPVEHFRQALGLLMIVISAGIIGGGMVAIRFSGENEK